MNERRESPGRRTFHALANTLMGLLLLVIVGAVLFVGSCVSAFANEWNMFPDSWGVRIPDNACQGKVDGPKVLRMSGDIVATVPCVNGKIHGNAIVGFPGDPVSKIPYVNGKKHGTQVTDHHGRIIIPPDGFRYVGIIETPWENDKKHGTEIWRTLRTVSGEFHSKIPYVNGKKHGTELIYSGDRISKSIPWLNGEKHGTEKHWTVGYWHIPIREIPWANGKKHGKEIERGRKESTNTWENGVLVDFTRN